MQYTLRDGLTAYVEILKDDARKQYQLDVQIWATLAPHQKKASQPPALPAILS